MRRLTASMPCLSQYMRASASPQTLRGRRSRRAGTRIELDTSRDRVHAEGVVRAREDHPPHAVAAGALVDLVQGDEVVLDDLRQGPLDAGAGHVDQHVDAGQAAGRPRLRVLRSPCMTSSPSCSGSSACCRRPSAGRRHAGSSTRRIRPNFRRLRQGHLDAHSISLWGFGGVQVSRDKSATGVPATLRSTANTPPASGVRLQSARV